MPFDPEISIPTRERCQVCQCVSPVGFYVPDEIWRQAVPINRQHDVICVPCFVSYADERMIPWDRDIEFYPVSLRTHLEHTMEIIPA